MKFTALMAPELPHLAPAAVIHSAVLQTDLVTISGLHTVATVPAPADTDITIHRFATASEVYCVTYMYVHVLVWLLESRY